MPEMVVGFGIANCMMQILLKNCTEKFARPLWRSCQDTGSWSMPKIKFRAEISGVAA